VKYPNGMIVDFTAPGARAGLLYPTRITDANGNYITITYRGNIGPQLDTITDTLKREIHFHYDADNLLTAITGPGLQGASREVTRLQYVNRRLDYAFAEVIEAVKAPETVWLIEAIYYPGTSTGYWFGILDGVDAYSSYGMLAMVSERYGMRLDEQGTITPGLMTRERAYNYPLGPDATLENAPAYTTMSETWEGMDASPAVTAYGVRPDLRP
jgi:hypothetical protein